MVWPRTSATSAGRAASALVSRSTACPSTRRRAKSPPPSTPTRSRGPRREAKISSSCSLAIQRTWTRSAMASAGPRAPRSPWSVRSGLSKASPSSTRAACPSRCAPATSTSVDSLEVLELLSLGALILLSALLTGAEAAYFSLGRARLKRLAEEQRPEQGAQAPLLMRPHGLLVTLLVGITLVNIAASALAATMAARLFGPVGLPIAIGAMTVLLVIFGEVLPMTLAVEHPERYSAWVNRPVAWLSALLWPVRGILGALTALTLRLVGSERKRGEPEISEEELRTLVDVGAREGVVDRTEREMIHKVFELEDTLVREVMVPRPDMFCLDLSTPSAAILPSLREQLHSR